MTSDIVERLRQMTGRHDIEAADLYNCGAVENGLWTLRSRIDAHLSRKEQP